MTHVRTYRSAVSDGVVGVEVWGADGSHLNTLVVDDHEHHFVAAHSVTEVETDAASVSVSINGGPAITLAVPSRSGQPPISVDRLVEPGWREVTDPGGVDALAVKEYETAGREPRGEAGAFPNDNWSDDDWEND